MATSGPGSPSGLIASFLTRKRLLGPQAEYRLVTPICTALEVHSYKSALQLCAKLIKKHPENYIVLALRALTLSLASKPLLPASRTEILQLLEFVKTHANGEGLGDPDVLMFFGWVLDGMGKGDETLAMLAKATQRHPENEDVCVEAFLHYVRVGEQKAAQQVSMRMQRVFQSDKYLWWSIMIVVLQCRDPTSPTNALLLSLAERQLTSHYTALRDAVGESAPTAPSSDDIDGAIVPYEKHSPPEDRKGKGKLVRSLPSSSSEPKTLPSTQPKSLEYESQHEFFLVTRFLELLVQQDATKAPALVLPSLLPGPSDAELPSAKECLLQHFASAEGEKWCERGLGLEIWRREVELKYGSVAGGEWARGWTRLKKSLENGDTNWHTMLYLIRTTFAIAASSSVPFAPPVPTLGRSDSLSLPPPAPHPSTPSSEGQKRMEEIRELFRALIRDGEKGRKERGYMLALLEIERLEFEVQWGGSNLLDLVFEYFEQFSSKTCCFDDLKQYLEIFTPEQRAKAQEHLKEIIPVEGDLTLEKIQRTINASKIARFLSISTSEEAEAADAVMFLQKYLDALPLGKGLPPTELQPADDFALLASEAFVAAWAHSRKRLHLEKAIAVLTYALTRSAHAFQLRLLVINLLRLSGAPTLAMSQYALLGIKSVQYDTLSHVTLSRAATFSVVSGSVNERGVWEEAQAATKWYKVGEYEASEMPVRAFSFHNYTKIEDFSEFQDRLRMSVSKHLLGIETIRLRVLRGLLDADSTKASVSTLEVLILEVQKTPTVFSENRDFASLPNFQAQSSKSIWEATQMGARTNAGWLRAFTFIYANFFLPSAQPIALAADDLQCSELTPSESALLNFSRNCRRALSAALEDSDAETDGLSFFQEQDARFGDALQDETTLPWELLHVAEIALEGFCLLDLAVDQRLSELTETRPAEHAKLGKKVRTFRTSVRDVARSLVTRVNAYAKQVAKQRGKTSAVLAGLSVFPVFDEDSVTNLAHSLVESRRAMAEGLASAMHRRFSGK